jgi:O-antigen/teichoic acid export membrane protein
MDEERIFRTEGVRAELHERAVRSGVVTVASRGAQMGLQLIGAMVLARVLTPADFGVQAMVLPLAILVTAIVNQGLQNAIIHRETLDSRDASAMFWMAARANLFITAGMALLAPGLAWLYEEPRVTGVAILWAFAIYGATFSAIHEALLKRQMQFGRVVQAQLAAMAVSILVAIGVALLGGGHWALIVQVAVMELTRAGIMWVLSAWRPSRAARGALPSAVQEMRAYWSSLTGARAMSWIGDHLDRVLVGAVGGAPVLGLYDSAKRWAWFPFLELYLSLSDVAVASLSRVRNEGERFRMYARSAFTTILALSYPAIAFVFVEASAVLHVLLGRQWLEAAGFVRLLCIAAVGASVSRLMNWVYLSTGHTARQLRFTMLSTPVLLLAIVIGAVRGGAGVATAFAIGCMLLAVPSVLNAVRGTPLTFRDCAATFARPLIASLTAAIVLHVSSPYLPATSLPLVALLIRLPVFLSVYLLAWLVQPGGRQALASLASGARVLRPRVRGVTRDGGVTPRPA